MASQRAVLCGYYGKGNGGDEALLASLLQLLPAHVTPLVLSGNPEETTRQYGVEACDRMSPTAIFQALRCSDALIWGGGSLMQDATSALNPFYYGGLMSLAQGMGLKTIAWAQGIGPLKRPQTRWLAKQVFRRCTAVSVRDRASADLLTEWGVPFTLAPDPVWTLQAEPLAGLADIPSPRVAVALRAHPLLTAERLDCLIQGLLEFQQATQTFLLLIPFQPIQDLAIAQTIHARFPKNSQILTIANPRQLMGVFQGVELTIAMRLHGLIMAAAAGCRCVALSYDPKVTQLMQDLDLTGWGVEDLPTQASLISQTWKTVYGSGHGLSSDQIQNLVQRAWLHQDVLQAALNGVA